MWTKSVLPKNGCGLVCTPLRIQAYWNCLRETSASARSCDVGSKGESERSKREGRAAPVRIQKQHVPSKAYSRMRFWLVPCGINTSFFCVQNTDGIWPKSTYQQQSSGYLWHHHVVTYTNSVFKRGVIYMVFMHNWCFRPDCIAYLDSCRKDGFRQVLWYFSIQNPIAGCVFCWYPAGLTSHFMRPQ